MINAVSEDDGALHSRPWHSDLSIVTQVWLPQIFTKALLITCRPNHQLPVNSALEFQASPVQPVDNEGGHGRLLALRQALTLAGLDIILQYSKDTKLLPPASTSNLIVVLQQLVKKTGCWPTRFDLAGMTISGAAKARGGSADIYQGRIEEKIAFVKKIRRTQDTRDIVSENISNEVILCGYLPAHPNILPLLGVHREGDMQSLVYPWMESGDLTSYLKRYPNSNHIQLLHDISLGLQFLHERSIVHGDLKGVSY
ncbi:hypothetical protein H0H92_004441 [Tricholoma furcatifolium]|nr:hypothetical protein H0H92_004441 [Tricholoma furcatifolium]